MLECQMQPNARMTWATPAVAHDVLELRYGAPVMTPKSAIARVRPW